MKHAWKWDLSGIYPKLALVAVIVSIAVASGAAKKWA
jgi:hypothetical protein